MSWSVPPETGSIDSPVVSVEPDAAVWPPPSVGVDSAVGVFS
jgi:hypothetical protein